MKNVAGSVCVFLVLFANSAVTASEPFDGTVFKGRIAFSSDGNFNDEDDWGAFPVAAAILSAFGVTDKLVHVDYNNILVDNDARFYREMTASVEGCIDKYNIPRSVLYDCQTDLDGAVESIKNAINASSASDPLYYVLAGPMEVPYLGIQKSNPEKRKYVYCISHSAWNDGYTRGEQSLHRHNKRDVIPSGINWIQVKDGNANLAHPGGVGKRSTPKQWLLYRWLRDSRDERLQWIYTRLVAEGRADISDATMTYFLLTGDDHADLAKFERLLDRQEKPKIPAHRTVIRMEAENFRSLANYEVQSGIRPASHRLCVRASGNQKASIETPFHQPYAATEGRYNVAVRYLDAEDQRSRLGMFVEDEEQGESWTTAGKESGWKTHFFKDVVIRESDSLAVKVQPAEGTPVKLDYIELHYVGRAPE